MMMVAADLPNDQPRWVLDPPSAAERHGEIGGKARGLLRLRAAGAPVPQWIAISTEAARAALEPHRSELERLCRQVEAAPDDALVEPPP